MNLFYAPDISGDQFTLASDESKHLIRVLRMKSGDKITFTDGKGVFYDCEIKAANPKACVIRVTAKKEVGDKRPIRLHVAIAPTKNLNRFEWFLEKATEIGIDKIIPIICAHSERKTLKTERHEKVLVAAMKQSLKPRLPLLEQPVAFGELIKTEFPGLKFIAYIDEEVTLPLSKACLPGEDALILIGPEGDFSPSEVEQAKEHGFQPVSLGPSR